MNTKVLRAPEKRKLVFRWLKNQKANIFFLQETHFTENLKNDLKYYWNDKQAHSFGSSNSRGVSILLRKGTNIIVENCVSDKDGRKLLMNCRMGKYYFTLLNVYAPNEPKERQIFFNDLTKWIANNAKFDLKAGGDFKCVLNPKRDKRSDSKRQITKESRVFRSFCKADHLKVHLFLSC